MAAGSSRTASEEEVLAYLRGEHAEVAELAEWVRGLLLEVEPDFAERIYRGWRAVGYVHPEAGYLVGLFPRGAKVRLFLEYGSALADPEGVLTGQGRGRWLDVSARDEARAETVRAYVQRAIVQRLLEG